MAKTCPYCRASLPSTGDPFCPHCRHDLDESPSSDRNHRGSQNDAVSWGDPRQYTLVGRLVILIYVLLGFAGTAAFVAYLMGSLPPGRYPILFFVAPFVILGFLLCANTFHVLEKWGVRIYADSPDPESRKWPPNP